MESFTYFVKMALMKHISSSFISWECCHFRSWSNLQLHVTICLHWMDAAVGILKTGMKDNTSRTVPKGRGLPWASLECVVAKELDFLCPSFPHVFDLPTVEAGMLLPAPSCSSAFSMKDDSVNLLLSGGAKHNICFHVQQRLGNNTSINESGWLSIDWWPHLRKKMSRCGAKHFINHF